MRRAARIWPNLTHIALSLALWSGCGGSQLPLEADPDGPSVPGQGKLPVEFAGSGAPKRGAAATPSCCVHPDEIMPPARAICGNGVIEAATENCDRTNLNGATCASLGYNGGGELRCNPMWCHYDTTLCRMAPPTIPPPAKPDFGADAGIDDAGQ
ncbi:MAG TPA: hypothetical protein VJR89_29070 [Polyangiales bacterium]|nr:hypothetical protein [Polyangiales bacterium]